MGRGSGPALNTRAPSRGSALNTRAPSRGSGWGSSRTAGPVTRVLISTHLKGSGVNGSLLTLSH